MTIYYSCNKIIKKGIYAILLFYSVFIETKNNYVNNKTNKFDE